MLNSGVLIHRRRIAPAADILDFHPDPIKRTYAIGVSAAYNLLLLSQNNAIFKIASDFAFAKNMPLNYSVARRFFRNGAGLIKERMALHKFFRCDIQGQGMSNFNGV